MSRRRKNRIRLTGTVLALLTVAGCSSPKAPTVDDTAAAAGPSTQVSDPPAVKGRPAMIGKQADPPLRFDPAGLFLGTDEVLLHGALAFAGTWEGVAVTRLTDGSRVGLLAPSDGPPAQDDPGYHRPVLVGTRVVTPYVLIDGAAQKGRLVVADAATGASTGTVEIAVPPIADRYGNRLTVVGGQGDVAVVLSGSSGHADPGTVETVVVNLATGKTLWTMPGLEAHAVLENTIIGLTGHLLATVTGRRVTDGDPLWLKPGSPLAGITAAGPKFAMVNGLTADNGERVVALVNAAGKTIELATEENSWLLTCHHDQRSVVACDGSREAFGIDTTTGKVLWRRPAGVDPHPRLTAAWHGAVYGQAYGKPFVLDARTGKDRGAEAGLAPAAVNAYGGVSERSFHPAVG